MNDYSGEHCITLTCAAPAKRDFCLSGVAFAAPTQAVVVGVRTRDDQYSKNSGFHNDPARNLCESCFKTRRQRDLVWENRGLVQCRLSAEQCRYPVQRRSGFTPYCRFVSNPGSSWVAPRLHGQHYLLTLDWRRLCS